MKKDAHAAPKGFALSFHRCLPLETSADWLVSDAVGAIEIGEWTHRQLLHYGPSPGRVPEPTRLVRLRCVRYRSEADTSLPSRPRSEGKYRMEVSHGVGGGQLRQARSWNQSSS